MRRNASLLSRWVVIAWLALLPIRAHGADPKTAPESIALHSSAFAANAPIPDRYSAYHEGESPPLAWSGVPADARSLALLVEDPDAHGPVAFTHWLVAGIPTSVRELPAGLPSTALLPGVGGARQGATAVGRPGWFGPRPPAGDPPHHYHFQLFALDAPLQLKEGFDRDALLDAMRGHVIARGELIGTYRQSDKAGGGT